MLLLDSTVTVKNAKYTVSGKKINSATFRSSVHPKLISDAVYGSRNDCKISLEGKIKNNKHSIR